LAFARIAPAATKSDIFSCDDSRIVYDVLPRWLGATGLWTWLEWHTAVDTLPIAKNDLAL
jgi:hypothetical protein